MSKSREWSRSAGLLYVVLGIFGVCVVVIGGGGMSAREMFEAAASLDAPNVAVVLVGLIAYSAAFGAFLLWSGRASILITAIGVAGAVLAIAWGAIASAIWAVPAIMLWRGEREKGHDA
jgi:hypothetical protein